jgi:inhibitor of cysteine peptidase
MRNLAVSSLGMAFLALTLLAPLPALAADPPPAAGIPVYSLDGQAIEVPAGGSFAIELEANATTGYQWAAEFDAAVLEQVDRTYTVTAPPHTEGGGGIERFVFKGLAAGTVTLKFKYFRSFEPPTTPPVETRAFPVTVGAPTPVFREDGQAIDVPVGGSFAIELAANATTGYQWAVAFDEKIVKQADHTYTVTAPPGRVGGGGVARFVFVGLAAGKTRLKFKYLRSFDPPETRPAETRTFPVRVRAAAP